MSTEQNKILVRRLFEEGFNQQKPQVFDELLDPNYVNYDFPAPAPGAEGFKMVAIRPTISIWTQFSTSLPFSIRQMSI